MDGKKNGQGTYTFANGGRYIGDFKDGNYHGQGTFIFASGVILIYLIVLKILIIIISY